MERQRIQSIDVLRGLVMTIMALDHVRDYFHIASFSGNPLDMATTTPLLYFTRWITHFCAPVFVFLAGTSSYLQGLRKSKRQLSSFLVSRGLWLIFVEMAVVTLAWTFNPAYNIIILQVIWAIGISMVILGLLIWLPYKIIFALGLLIVFGHNLLDFPEAHQPQKAGFLWDLLHHGNFVAYPFAPKHVLLIVYPFLPWTGLMMLGYCFGGLFTQTVTPQQRKKIINWMGISLILFFVVVRFINVYGNPEPWAQQPTVLFTILSFLNVHKYPPSLLYIAITIGPALLVLSWLENIQNRFTNAIRIYGRVAFFYYVVHLFLIHALSTVAFFMRGHSFSDGVHTTSPFYFVNAGEGYNLAVVYAVWIGVVLILYPVCKKYNDYKSSHKKWWLSYL